MIDLKLSGFKVAVRRDKTGEKTLSGLFVPVEAQSIPKQEGIVVAVGNKCEFLCVGDHVVFSKFVGIGFQLGNEEFLLCLEDEIIGKIQPFKSKKEGKS